MRPNDLNSDVLSKDALSLLQRILLATDGTVTDLLRLYTGEEIKARKIEQEIIHAGAPSMLLALPGTPILRRKVVLGSPTRDYLLAESFFVLEMLSVFVQSNLIETDEPIGLLWKEERTETYREVVDYRMGPCPAVSDYFDVQPDVPILSRTYLVFSNNRHYGIVTESFPATYFRDWT